MILSMANSGPVISDAIKLQRFLSEELSSSSSSVHFQMHSSFGVPILRYAFFGKNLTILVAAGPISVLIVPIFFSQILIIMEIRLKFQSRGHLAH